MRTKQEESSDKPVIYLNDNIVSQQFSLSGGYYVKR